MDAFEQLKQDHRRVETLFKRIEALGDNALKEKKALVAQLVRELAVHSSLEEQVMYPALRAKREAFEDNVLESLEEHLLVKWTLNALDKMPASNERYDAKLSVLKEIVSHHVDEEETELFPKARAAFSAEENERLATTMERMRRFAPTRPHPRAPDTPPANYVAGAMASVVDHARDLVAGRKQITVRAAAKTTRRKPAGRKSPASKKTKASRRRR